MVIATDLVQYSPSISATKIRQVVTLKGPTLDIADNTLIDEARAFCIENKGKLTELSDDIGIPVRFFYDLAAGRVKNPGVRPIEKILRYKRMTGETLQSGLLAG